MGILYCIFLLLWMDTMVNGQEAIDFFINDLVATLQLTSPTILYNDDEMPHICFDSPWVLCLSIDRKELAHPDEGIEVPYLTCNRCTNFNVLYMTQIIQVTL